MLSKMESLEPISLKNFWKEINKFDIALLLVAPLILATLHFLPKEVQQDLYLNNTNPTFFSMYINNFLYGQEASTAFLNGIFQYLITIGTLYLLAILCKDRARFMTLFLIIMLLFPFGISIFNLFIVNRFFLTGDMRFAGSSGINAAFTALLIIYIFQFINRNFTPKLDVSDSPALFLTVLLVSLPKYFTKNNYWIAIIIILGALYIIYLTRIVIKTKDVSPISILNSIKKPGLTPIHLGIFASAIWITVFSPSTLFPAESIHLNYYVNIYSHFIGYIAGFLVPYLIYNKLQTIQTHKKLIQRNR